MVRQNETYEPKYQLKEDIPKNLKKLEFKDTYQPNPNFVSNDDIPKLHANIDSIFPLRFENIQVGTPIDQGVTLLNQVVKVVGSDVLFRNPFPYPPLLLNL